MVIIFLIVLLGQFHDGDGAPTTVVGPRGLFRNGGLRQHIHLSGGGRAVRDGKPCRHRLGGGLTSPSAVGASSDAGQAVLPRRTRRPSRHLSHSSRRTFPSSWHCCRHLRVGDPSPGGRFSCLTGFRSCMLAIARQALVVFDRRHESLSVSPEPDGLGTGSPGSPPPQVNTVGAKWRPELVRRAP